LKPVYGPFAPFDRNLLSSKSVDEVDGDAKTEASATRSRLQGSQAKQKMKDEGAGASRAPNRIARRSAK
jgi:hypothetical protein